MARKAKEDWVTFRVDFEDGTVASIEIDKFTLSRGDHVARVIARERQANGTLRSGTIKSVRRLRPYLSGEIVDRLNNSSETTGSKNVFGHVKAEATQ
jgi:hypothetical protein